MRFDETQQFLNYRFSKKYLEPNLRGFQNLRGFSTNYLSERLYD